MPLLPANGGVVVEGRPEIYISSVDLRMVVGLILYLTKQAGNLAIEKMRRKSKLPWKPTIPSLNWWNKYAWILILLVMGMFSSAHSLPSLNPKLTSPGK